MSNGLLMSKQTINSPSNKQNNLDNQIKKQTTLEQLTGSSVSSNDSLKRGHAGQLAELQRPSTNNIKRLVATSTAHNQPILIDLGRSQITTKQINPQEVTRTNDSCCSVLRNLNSVIVQPSILISSSPKSCNCQTSQQQQHFRSGQDNYRSSGPSSDVSGHLVELSGNKYLTDASNQYQQEKRRRSEHIDRRYSISNRAPLKRPLGQTEQASIPVVAVDINQSLSLVSSPASSAQASLEGSQKQIIASCNEQDEIDEESGFDYEKVLSNILNEKKLALLNSPDVRKFIARARLDRL